MDIAIVIFSFWTIALFLNAGCVLVSVDVRFVCSRFIFFDAMFSHQLFWSIECFFRIDILELFKRIYQNFKIMFSQTQPNVSI